MRNKNNAFTLIELLVVVSIIAMLVGILSVAQRKVRIISQNLRQKAAFHAGEISLELYARDYGGYPDSSLVSAGTHVTGAQRLAEAFFGRDDQGFNPKTKWHPTLDAADLYDATVTAKDRKVPYFERKRAGFHSIYDIWQGDFGTSSIYHASQSSEAAGVNKTMVSPVFTDIFTSYKTATGQSAGMPILYFKADPTKKFRTEAGVEVKNPTSAQYSKWVYNFDDNLPLLQLPWLQDKTQTDGLAVHYPDEDKDGDDDNPAQVFYEKLTQREDGNFFLPHNKSTFLLISAGHDGIYGTKDDLTNFDN